MSLSRSSKAYQICIVAGAAITWLAVIAQLYLNIQNRVLSLPQTIIKFASYFTIQTNILVAVCFTCVALKPNGKLGKYFLRPQVASAITVYIFVVGLVYNTVLRWQWSPKGLQLVVDNLLHVVTPIWFLVYWALFVPKAFLQNKNVWAWLIYPLVYCFYILIRGAITNRYPYFFVDASKYTYSQVFINIAVLVLVFLGLSFLLVVLAKRLYKKTTL
ncbi:Pr6Pr family membrane protein [Parasediminibacterium paludis]|uniref:Pr6Pr family membrane protein n=1 Tax=Parasediminibacterium paludis TaxID=908966 RepID=A0ABV8PZH1_9BACT